MTNVFPCLIYKTSQRIPHPHLPSACWVLPPGLPQKRYVEDVVIDTDSGMATEVLQSMKYIAINVQVKAQLSMDTTQVFHSEENSADYQHLLLNSNRYSMLNTYPFWYVYCNYTCWITTIS